MRVITLLRLTHAYRNLYLMSQVMTTAQAASRLRTSRCTVVRMAHAGLLEPLEKLPGLRGAFLFRPADVEALAAERGR